MIPGSAQGRTQTCASEVQHRYTFFPSSFFRGDSEEKLLKLLAVGLSVKL